MRIGFFAAGARIALLSLLVQGAAVQAAEVKLLCSSALSGVLTELGPQFERATGHKLALEFDFSVVFKRRIEAGEAFDVTIMSPIDDDLIKQGKITAGTITVFGRNGIGVGVRKGAPKPDISPRKHSSARCSTPNRSPLARNPQPVSIS